MKPKITSITTDLSYKSHSADYSLPNDFLMRSKISSGVKLFYALRYIFRDHIFWLNTFCLPFLYGTDTELIC